MTHTSRNNLKERHAERSEAKSMLRAKMHQERLREQIEVLKSVGLKKSLRSMKWTDQSSITTKDLVELQCELMRMMLRREITSTDGRRGSSVLRKIGQWTRSTRESGRSKVTGFTPESRYTWSIIRFELRYVSRGYPLRHNYRHSWAETPRARNIGPDSGIIELDQCRQFIGSGLTEWKTVAEGLKTVCRDCKVTRRWNERVLITERINWVAWKRWRSRAIHWNWTAICLTWSATYRSHQPDRPIRGVSYIETHCNRRIRNGIRGIIECADWRCQLRSLRIRTGRHCCQYDETDKNNSKLSKSSQSARVLPPIQ